MINCFRIICCVIFASLLVANKAEASKIKLHIRIVEDDTRQVTPAMICITSIGNGKVYTIPHGDTAEAATYPADFFKGVHFSDSSNWRGPIRKMAGPGAVNGQRTYVYGNLPTLPYWSDPVMYQVSGDFTITLDPGKWKISIQHGNEYIPVTDTLKLTARQKKLTKTFVLKRWINLPAMGWYSGDVHAHHPVSNPSFKNYMLRMAKAEDVHMVNLLEMGDRYTTEFKAEGFGDAYRICEGNICLAFGQEEPRSDYGHIIGLNISALARDTAFYNYYDLVFGKMHQRPEALIGYAHFAYRGEGVTKGMAMYAPGGHINFVELLQNTKINTSDYYAYLDMGFKIAAAAGSDFPWGSTIGDGRTFVYTGKPFSAAGWFAGLKAGHSFVSNGPALFLDVEGKIPGMTVSQKMGSQTDITVTAISNKSIGVIDRVEIHTSDGLLLSRKNQQQADSVTIKLAHLLRESQWIVAAVYCENGALAHTSAVYCVVDNQPVFNKTKAQALIQKQQMLIDEMRVEEKEKQDPDAGILKRLDQADEFYEQLKKVK